MKKELMMAFPGNLKSDSEVDNNPLNNCEGTFTSHSSLLGPTLTLYKGQVVHYCTSTTLYSLWSLFTTSHSILQSRRTWVQTFYMTMVAVISFLIVHLRGIAGSISLIDIATEMRVLVSFILGGYIAQCVGKWNTTTSHLISVINQLMNVMKIVDISQSETGNDDKREKIFRYCRLSIQLLFFIGSQKSNFDQLVLEGILTEDENKLLQEYPLSSRGDIVCAWIDSLLLKVNLYESCRESITHVRACNRELVDGYYRQLPFIYAHCVYWGLQFIFVAIACQSGIMVALFFHSKSSGDGSFDDDASPENPNIWLFNASFGMVVTKIIFILFANGLLHVCERIQNPLDGRTSSFSRGLNDITFVSSCNAYRAALKH